MRNLQNVQVKIGSGFETVCPFPVGAIYQSTSSTSPASIYGGEWTPLTDGRFLRPQGSWNNLGGENEHKLTVAEMPSHQHISTDAARSCNVSSGSGYTVPCYNSYGNNGGWTSWTGGSTAHNNIPPHIEHVIAGIEFPNILGGVLC